MVDADHRGASRARRRRRSRGAHSARHTYAPTRSPGTCRRSPPPAPGSAVASAASHQRTRTEAPRRRSGRSARTAPPSRRHGVPATGRGAPRGRTAHERDETIRITCRPRIISGARSNPPKPTVAAAPGTHECMPYDGGAPGVRPPRPPGALPLSEQALPRRPPAGIGLPDPPGETQLYGCAVCGDVSTPRSTFPARSPSATRSIRCDTCILEGFLSRDGRIRTGDPLLPNSPRTLCDRLREARFHHDLQAFLDGRVEAVLRRDAAFCAPGVGWTWDGIGVSSWIADPGSHLGCTCVPLDDSSLVGLPC